jgi:outer membrane receptor protein involved in Fe transport
VPVPRLAATGWHDGMEEADMHCRRTGSLILALLTAPLLPAAAQDTGQTGTVHGTIKDDQGSPVAEARIDLSGTPSINVTSRANGEYTLQRVPAGSQTIRVRMIGYRPTTATVAVEADQTVEQDFTLQRDPLELQTLVVTGTQTPRINIESSVALTTLTPEEIQQAAPRSTTEMLRYVPGFTRVESSGGEVNENISMRGILGVEYVMFMEDGLPVFPTMHTFFMNADNLFRADENLDRMEVVRGGASALFGSNTPGAIINFINKTGGDEFSGTMRATAGTEGLARYDLNANGPLGENWRFNVGGFYRYDHGVRDPGFPGIRGGQAKASITRLLPNGTIRLSAKVIDDRNQFILPLPFTNPGDPKYVSGFGDYGSMNTREALDLRVPIPTGDLTLPLDNGLRTSAGWLTGDVSLDLAGDWHVQNTAGIMQNQQEWNALVPSNVMTVDQFINGPKGQAGLELPAGTTIQLTYTNHFDDQTPPSPLAFNTANGLVAPGQLIHVSKPLSAFQNQLSLRKTIGKHAFSVGGYFANYSQENHWNFTQVLTDVRDNPRFLDAVVTTPGGTPTAITQNGFLNYLSGYANGDGQATIVSGVAGAEVQLAEKLRVDGGVRVEYDNFVQSSENTATFDLDADPTTTFNNETFGNNSFRHFEKGITDWAGSVGINYLFRPELSFYVSGSRGYKMPALDELLNAQAQDQVDLFDSREVQSVEGGVKGSFGLVGFTVNGFYTKLKHIVSQGLVVDSVTGGSSWIIVTSPENRSYGAELEVVAAPVSGLRLFGSGTFLRAELGSGAGADIGSRLNGVPTSIGNLAATYTRSGFQLKGDWHWVDKRFVDVAAGVTLPSYNYFNFGASYTLRSQTATIYADLLNAFQSTGLEEGNPRLLSSGGTGLFLARPILPRRFTLAVRYNFGQSSPLP